MRSPTEPTPSRQLTPELFAFCLLLASSLQIMEHLLPKIPIFPWLRLGLAYLILLPFLLRFGVGQTLMLFACRNLITLIYGGQIFSSFLISTLSGFFSIGIAGSIVSYLYRKKMLGLVGTSVSLACAFNLMQLVVVNFLFIRHGDFFFQLSPLLLWSLISGSLIAFVVHRSFADLDLLFGKDRRGDFLKGEEKKGATPHVNPFSGFIIVCCLFISLLIIDSIAAQLILLPVIVAFSRFRNIKVIYYAWPFYFYLAWLHLFRTDGIFIYKDWITREGLHNFILYAARTTNIIICGQWLAKYLSGMWRKTVGNFYLHSIGYALPLLPALFGLSLAMGKEFVKQMRSRKFGHPLYAVINRLEMELGKINQKGV